MVASEVLIEPNAFIKAVGDMVSFFFFFLIFNVVEESLEEETRLKFLS